MRENPSAILHSSRPRVLCYQPARQGVAMGAVVALLSWVTNCFLIGSEACFIGRDFSSWLKNMAGEIMVLRIHSAIIILTNDHDIKVAFQYQCLSHRPGPLWSLIREAFLCRECTVGHGFESKRLTAQPSVGRYINPLLS